MVNPVIRYYSQFDEWGRLDREPLEYMVNLHFIRKYLPEAGHILDNGAGPGKYAMELARSGYEVTLTDLTPSSVESAREKAAAFGLTSRFKGFHSANAADLSIFPDGLFDSTLMMGPLYHLQQAEERDCAVRELYRVTKNGGVVFVAFMSRIRHLMTSLAEPLQWKPNDNVEKLREFLETGWFNHADEGRFTGAYYYNIDDIVPFMESHGFQTLKLIGSSGAAAGLSREQMEYWRKLGKQEFDSWMDIIYSSADKPYLLGVSSHLLFIGKRS